MTTTDVNTFKDFEKVMSIFGHARIVYFFLWDLLKTTGHYQTGLLNARILNKLIEFFSIMGREGKAAHDVFHKFEAFQCEPNQDTYYFTVQGVVMI
ncbi:PPR containing plant protein [Medicago truncatula]|uniref:PPR containing plant protein n=1 Tax=Medicago truncatula TaxID=3880 RepID=G7KEF4_MEDTR|nr:PPR containing plant protein [Medicago truncatula]